MAFPASKRELSMAAELLAEVMVAVGQNAGADSLSTSCWQNMTRMTCWSRCGRWKA